MHCMSVDGDYLDCNDCKECNDLTCDKCEFFSDKFGCCLSHCDFKYSNVSKNKMKEYIHYDMWR